MRNVAFTAFENVRIFAILGRSCRFIFLAYLIWLLVIFLPSHTRGKITMGPREDSCCAPAKSEASCCSSTGIKSEHPVDKEPTQRDRANCAVCFWAAGLLPGAIFVLLIALLGELVRRIVFTTPQVQSLRFDFPFYPVGPPVC